jgi:hypothetical protein
MERPSQDESATPQPAERGGLENIRPIGHEEDERPNREDRDYGHTIFTAPDFLRPRRRRKKQGQD